MERRVDAKRTEMDEAAHLISDGQTVVCGGFVGAGHPEGLTKAIERRYLAGKGPHDLTVVYAAGQGDGATRGLNHLAHVGLVRRVIGGHWGLAPQLGKLARTDAIEAYNFPQGVICQLLRDIAAGRPGCITQTGLDTFVDPAREGGRLNRVTPPELVERVLLGGETYLWFKSFPIDVALLRATSADIHGNLTMEGEALIGEVLPMAQAARNSGGLVIAQIKRIVDHAARPGDVRVPGILVDKIVVADAADHAQTFQTPFDAELSLAGSDGDDGIALSRAAADSLNGVRRIIAERAAREVQPGDIVNLGIGLPEGIAIVASEQGWLGDVTLTLESGPIGGQPLGGLNFGAARLPQAIIDQPAQFDFYDGGGLDFAALGAAQIDRDGNVNVSQFGDRTAGVGGFINISQNAKRVVFCTTLTTDGLEVESSGCGIRVVREGTTQKWVERVDQVSFSGAAARRRGQDVLYITERAVFRLGVHGIELTELAPGITPRDVVPHMGFLPIIAIP